MSGTETSEKSPADSVTINTRSSIDKGSGGRRKKTTKMLLESYYGIGSEDVSSSATPSTDQESAGHSITITPAETSASAEIVAPSKKSSTDLDGAGFDPDKYLGEVLQNYTLKDLVSEKDKLRTQAKALDEDMKTLVYENYHKFVIATETINEIQVRASTAEGEMAQLSSMVAAAAHRSDDIGRALEGKRGDMKRLLAVSRHLKRLQFAVDLPARLRRCIELRAFHEAIAYYARALVLFERNRAVPAFVQIAKECDAIMSDVRNRLRSDIVVPRWPPEEKEQKQEEQTQQSPAGTASVAGDPTVGFPFREVCEAAELLRELKEPEDWVREKFLGSYEVAFEALYAHVCAPERGARAETVGNAVLGLLIRIFTDYCSVFFPDFRVGDDIRRTGMTRSPNWNPIQSFLEEKVNKYIHYVQERVAEQARATHAHAPIPLPEVLGSLEKVQAPIRQVNHVLPFLTIAARAGNILGSILVLYVDARFDALTPAIAETLDTLERTCSEHKYDPEAGDPASTTTISAFWASAAADTAAKIVAELEGIVDELRPLTSPDTNKSFINQAPKICVRTHVKTQQFFFNVESALKSYIKIDDNPNDKLAQRPFGPFLLVLSAIARRVAASVDYFGKKVSDEFPSESEIPLILVDDLKARFVRLSTLLLESFVTAEGGVLSSYMQRYINTADWLSEKEPRKVGFGTLMFVRSVADINSYLTPIFKTPVPDVTVSSSAATPSSAASSTLLTSSSSPYSSANSSASAFFAAAAAASGKRFYGRRPEAMRTVDFSHSSVLCGVIRLGLKSMFESVRLQSFANGGFHSIQVDKHYLEKELIKIAGPISEINNTLDDIEMNAYERCIDPTNLEISVIESKLLAPSINDN